LNLRPSDAPKPYIVVQYACERSFNKKFLCLSYLMPNFQSFHFYYYHLVRQTESTLLPKNDLFARTVEGSLAEKKVWIGIRSQTFQFQTRRIEFTFGNQRDLMHRIVSSSPKVSLRKRYPLSPLLQMHHLNKLHSFSTLPTFLPSSSHPLPCACIADNCSESSWPWASSSPSPQ